MESLRETIKMKFYTVFHIKCPHAQGAFSTIRSKHQWGRHTGLPLRHALILPLLHGIVRFRAKLLRRGEPMCSPFLFFDFRSFILQTGIGTWFFQIPTNLLAVLMVNKLVYAGNEVNEITLTSGDSG